jgi:hypothetical protein
MRQINSNHRGCIGHYLSNSHTTVVLSFFLITLVTIWRVKYKIFGSTDPFIFRDFLHAYYPAGRLIIEDLTQLYSFSKTVDGATQPVIYGFVNLPIVAYLFTPFSLFGENTANLLYFILGVAAIIWAAWLLVRQFKLRSHSLAIFIGIVGINAPIFNSLWLGNSTHLVILPLIASLFYFNNKKYVWSGIFLAIAGLIKLPLFFLLCYFLLKKRWSAVWGFGATLLLVVAASILVCGFSLNVTWFQQCILSFADKTFAGDTLQSVDSFLIRLLTHAPIDSFEPIAVDWRFKLVRYAGLLVLVGGTFWVVFQSRNIESTTVNSLEFCTFLTLALVISPISWTHYYLLLLLPIALYLNGGLALPKPWNWLMGASIALVIAPNVRNSPVNHPVVEALTRHFLVSHYFWGGILMLGLLWLALHKQVCRQRSLEDVTC